MIFDTNLRLSVLLALSGVFVGGMLLIAIDVSTTARASSGAHHALNWSEVILLTIYFAIAWVLAYRWPSVGVGYAIITGIGSVFSLGTAAGFVGLSLILLWGGGPHPSEILLFGSAAFGFISGIVLIIASTRFVLLNSQRERAKYPLAGAALAILCLALIRHFSR